jgi:hypothetical protein
LHAAGDADFEIAPFFAKRPSDTRASEIKRQTVMLLKVHRRFRRAFPSEIDRCRTHNATALGQLAGDESTIRQFSHPKGHVCLLREQVDHVIGEAEIDAYIGMAG